MPASQFSCSASFFKLNIQNDEGYLLSSTVKLDKKFEFKVFFDFSYHGKKVTLENLDAKKISGIIKDYKLHVENLVLEENFSNANVSLFGSASLLITRKLRISNPIKELYNGLRRINVCTVDNSKNETLVRTTIELDADILTILNPKLCSHRIKEAVLSLHDSNIKLANRFYQYKLSRVVFDLRNLVNAMRMTTIPISAAHMGFDLVNMASEPNLLIGFMVNAVAFPILWKFMPKIVMRIIFGVIRSAIILNK